MEDRCHEKRADVKKEQRCEIVCARFRFGRQDTTSRCRPSPERHVVEAARNGGGDVRRQDSSAGY
jgi:hypothetical protein